MVLTQPDIIYDIHKVLYNYIEGIYLYKDVLCVIGNNYDNGGKELLLGGKYRISHIKVILSVLDVEYTFVQHTGVILIPLEASMTVLISVLMS